MAAFCELTALSRNAARSFIIPIHDFHVNLSAGASGRNHIVGVKCHEISSSTAGNGVKGAIASHSLSRFVCRSSESNAVLNKDELFKDAAKAGDLNALRELVGSGEVDINLPSPARAGWTALQLGAFYDHSEVISYLLWAGADTEVRNDSGNSALQFACLKGNVEITRILLEAGADLDAVSNDKGTAYDYAQEWGGDEIVDFLLLWAASQANA